MKEIKYIDLFCGLGAFHTAFNRQTIGNNNVKYKCIFACDIDKGIRKVYKENYKIEPHGDIATIDIPKLPDFDILCAGFPCQPFSICGKKEGLDDAQKGQLFYRILDIIDVKHPNTLILENVKNLETIHNGNTFKIIKEKLEERGYKLSYKVLDSKHFNCPQSRQRIFIVCNKNKNYVFNDVKNKLVPVSSIIDFNNKKYLDYSTKYDLVKNDSKHKSSNLKYRLINKVTKLGGRQGERVYGLGGNGPTICATSGGPGPKTGLYEIEAGKIRTLNVTETLKMFGFDTNYKYSSLRNSNKMLFYLGNSIVVNVLEHVISNLETQILV
jgi:DNA (cytosine-5)-methyltransferase 1